MTASASANVIRTTASFAPLAAGWALLVASYWMPWYHIGNPFSVRPECAFSGGPFPIPASSAAAAALILWVVRRSWIVLIPASLALGFVLLALSTGFGVSGNVCGPASTSGPAYGWFIALAGAALAFLGAIASWRWPSSKGGAAAVR